MGYRSEVAIRCQKNAFPKFKAAYEKAKFNPDKLLTNEDEYLIYWDWIKWYDDYEIVQEINNVMAELDFACDGEQRTIYDSKLGYRFMRLGEDDTDVETRENTCDVQLYMIRKIDLSDFE